MGMTSLSDVKVQLRLEEDFTEHDDFIESLIDAAQRSIERTYYCVLVDSQAALENLPESIRGFLIEADYQLAARMMVAQWYLNPKGTSPDGDTPAQLGVEHLLFPLMEHTV
ncbi:MULTISPECIES: head-tail connector protein [Yersinia]|uniref:head-tail connector protein n=1 Tax=Yersinia TaxID=629 RepID=UPI0011AA1CFB|nr:MULTISPECIES: head-tail connector protein [Yersinia]MDN0096178.1 head-tail connector protein [Yersinia rohdei]